MPGLALLGIVALFCALAVLCEGSGAPSLLEAEKVLKARKRRLVFDENGKQHKDGMTQMEADAHDDIDFALKALDSVLSRGTRQSRDDSASPLARTRAAGDYAAVTGMRDLREDDPKCGYDTPRQYIEDVLAAFTTQTIPEKLHGLAITDHGDSGFRPLAAAGSDEQSVFADPYGGFLVPEGFSPTVLQVRSGGDPLAQYVREIPMPAPVLKIPYRVDKDHSTSVSGGLRVYRRAEADTVTASRVQMGQLRLEAQSLMGIAYATEELLQDAPQVFAALLADSFNEEFSSQLGYERFNGTGVGEFLGVFNSGALLEIDKIPNQYPGSLIIANILQIRSRVWDYENAVWVASPDTIPALGTLTIDNGISVVPIMLPDARQDVSLSILGRPVIFSDEVPTLGSAGDIGCYNFREFLEGTYQRRNGVSSIHVRFVNHERTFKFTMRNAGAPWWDSVLTPKNGNTRSPFVRLKARD